MEPRGVSVIVKYVGRASGGALYDKKTKRRITYVRCYPVEVSAELAAELLEDQQNETPEWVEVRKRD